MSDDSRLTAPDVLDDHQVESVGVCERRVDLAGFEPEVRAAGRTPEGLDLDDPVALDVRQGSATAGVSSATPCGVLAIEYQLDRHVLDLAIGHRPLGHGRHAV